MLKRYYTISDYLIKNKVLVIYGPRRVGKTTLLNDFLKNTSLKYRVDSGDNISVRNILSSSDFKSILEYASGLDLLAIDEAQLIPDIGHGLKILVDNLPDLYIIATGSSSFDLANKIGEPLTGRKRTITLYPFSQLELSDKYSKYDLKQNLDNYLIYGSYPEVITATSLNDKKEILMELVNSYIYKDILAIENIRSPQILKRLLQLLAFQVGNEVSFSELSNSLGIDVKTVQKYLYLLEKCFIIQPLTAFSRNLRNEITGKNKYYFLDIGIRNAIISQLNDLSLRNDIGQLLENFVFIERFKSNSYKKLYINFYFWRTYSQKEIDIIEENNGAIRAYEIKWSTNKQIKAPKEWINNYPNASFSLINRDNYLDFIM